MNENAVFLLTATGAAIDVKCGFIPAKVEVVNVTSANKPALSWYRGMIAAHAIKTQNSGRTVITSNGISPIGASESSGVEKGFRIGADADVNVSTNQLVAIAYRGGPGNQV